jgi:hypothetical protein
MLKEIRKIIHAMDVKKDPETAQSNAQAICQLGPEAMDVLVDIGTTVNVNEADVATRRKLIRAIILSLSKFATKNLFLKPRLLSNEAAIHLLCNFSEQGFNSARTVLSSLGFSHEDIIKKRLMSLPVVDSRERDHEITLNEAIQEIKTADVTSHIKKVKNQGYIIGTTNKHVHEIFRTGKNKFAYRIRRL